MQTGEILGLVNTTYSIGAILSGWFLGGPIVSFPPSESWRSTADTVRPIGWDAELGWVLVASSLLLRLSFKHFRPGTSLVFSSSVVFLLVSDKEWL